MSVARRVFGGFRALLFKFWIGSDGSARTCYPILTFLPVYSYIRVILFFEMAAMDAAAIEAHIGFASRLAAAGVGQPASSSAGSAAEDAQIAKLDPRLQQICQDVRRAACNRGRFSEQLP